MIYTYTTELPSTSPAENRRQFIRLPRSILLAPYLATNPYFVTYTDSIDRQFDYLVEAKIEALANLRNMWVSTQVMEDKVDNNTMVSFLDWGGPERALIVQQVNLLGMKLQNAGVVSESGYRAIAKFIGSYWFDKGKQAAVDFLNYCLGAGLTVQPMVSQDYVTFTTTDDPTAGPFVWDSSPGPWFQTTHVLITMPDTYPVDPGALGAFFYEICNYNLVLYAISIRVKKTIVTQDSSTTANVVLIAGIARPTIMGQTTWYPIKYHSLVGGWTGGAVDGQGFAIRRGGVGRPLQQISQVKWHSPSTI